MDFLTSTIISGIIYDILKQGTIITSYEMAKQVLSNFTNDEVLFHKFENVLNKCNITKDSMVDDIISELNKNNQMQSIINQIQNINIYGDNNTINITPQENKNKKFILEKVNTRFRNLKVDSIFGFGIFFTNLWFINYYYLGVSIILVFIYILYLPKVFPIMFIEIYEDKLLYLYNRKIMYSDIRNYKQSNSHFTFRLKQLSSYTTLILYKNNNAHFMFDAIDRYTKYMNKSI